MHALEFSTKKRDSLDWYVPRIVHGVTLVIGGVCFFLPDNLNLRRFKIVAGVAYELVSRPWDAARRIVQLNKITTTGHTPLSALMERLRHDQPHSFFRDPNTVLHSPSSPFYRALKILGRAGPWGIGFLVWEAYGPGLDQ